MKLLLSIYMLCAFYFSGPVWAMQAAANVCRPESAVWQALPEDHWLRTAIEVVQQIGAEAVEQFLMGLVPADAQALSKTPLLLDRVIELAREAEREEVVQFLLMFAVQHRKQESGQLLIDSARHGYADEVSVLLNAGEPANGRGDFEGVPLAAAAQTGYIEVMKRLLAHGAKADAADNKPLLDAARAGQRGAIDLLLEHGASINARYDEALSLAVNTGDQSVVAHVVACGAHVHSQHVFDAAARKDQTMLCVLLANGDREILLNRALERAVGMHDWQTGKLLIVKGACAREVAFRKAETGRHYTDIIDNLGQDDNPEVSCSEQ